jgi:phosphoglycerate dehydrogenase-like enzyme
VKLLIVAPLDEKALQDFRNNWAAKGLELDYQPQLAEERIADVLVAGDYDALIVRNNKISSEVLSRWAAAKQTGKIAVIRAGSNTSTIDVDAATRLGIPVLNTPGANSQAVAQYIIEQLLYHASMGKTERAAQDVKMGIKQDKTLYRHSELRGKTLALIGTRAIGSKVSLLASALGMKVVAYSPNLTEERAESIGATKAASLRDALRQADYVSIQVPYIAQGESATHHLLGRKELESLKDGARIVNVSRKDVISTPALISAVQSGKIGGISFDLLQSEIEELKKEFPGLFTEKNVITPLIACETAEADQEITTQSLSRVLNYFASTHSRAVSVVNPDFANHDRIKKLSSKDLPSIDTYGLPTEKFPSALINVAFAAIRSAMKDLESKKPQQILVTNHASADYKRAEPVPAKLASVFREDNIITESQKVPGIGIIYIAYEAEATPEHYAYSGIRVLSPMSAEEALTNAKRLSLTASSWKNWLINHAIKDGALEKVPYNARIQLPPKLQQASTREIYGGRVIVIPEKALFRGNTIEEILKDSSHPYFAEVSTPIYRALGERLNQLKGKLRVTPDFGPNAYTANIMHDHTEYTLGISADRNGSGGKSEYSITSILSVIRRMGIDKAPKDSPITVIGSAGALGSGIVEYLRAEGFNNVLLCDLQYANNPPQSLPSGWRIAKAQNGKFTDECLQNTGKGAWLITAAYGDEMSASNWKKIKPGTIWIGAQNKDLPNGMEGIEFARTLKDRGILHLPGQLLTIGGTAASWVEHESRKFPGKAFPREAAHEVVQAVTNTILEKILAEKEAGSTPYEALLAYSDKQNWQAIPSKPHWQDRSYKRDPAAIQSRL